MSGSRLKPLPLIIFAVFHVSLASAFDLPAGKGRETFQKVCMSCHDADVSAQQRKTRGAWTDLVRSMKDMGAEASTAEFGEIVDYLALNFGESAGQDKKSNPVASTGPAESNRSPVRRALPWEKSPLRIGQALYRENCVVCHDVDVESSKKTGPSFYHLFQREKMPQANRRPSPAYVAAKIRAGGTLMPAFNRKLRDDEIDSLIEYMLTK